MQDYLSFRAKLVPKVYRFTHILFAVFAILRVVMACLFATEAAFLLSIVEIMGFMLYTALFVVMKNDNDSVMKSLTVCLHVMIIEMVCNMSITILGIGINTGFEHYVYVILLFIMFVTYVTMDFRMMIIDIIAAGTIHVLSVVFASIFGPMYSVSGFVLHFYVLMNPIIAIILVMTHVFILTSVVIGFEHDIVYQMKHDVLTGLLNRNVLSELDYHDMNTYVAMIDIDNFKNFNDTFGHDVGDMVLKSLARQMLRISMYNDGVTVLRWGGEEFLLVYYDNGVKDFEDILTELQTDINSDIVDTGTKKLMYHVTMGGASHLDGHDLEGLVKVADERLYEGKSSGKNCIVLR